MITYRIRQAALHDLERCIEIDASYITTQVWQFQDSFDDWLIELPDEQETSGNRARPGASLKTGQPTPLSYKVELQPSRLPHPLAVLPPLNEQELLAEWKLTDCLLVAESVGEPSLANDIFDGEVDPPPTEIIGYVGLRVDPRRHLAWLSTGAVHMDFRRQTIGSQLLKEALAWADRNRLRSVLVEVQTKNFPAIAFLQKNGFFFCGFNNAYYPTREIALFFARRLERFLGDGE
jgi:ribosomal protein S18 acetylase RimI-like enzyme